MAVHLKELDDFRGQPTLRIETPTATYFYHQQGGGFAAILDPDGADWIGYAPGDGPRGEYRGIPNLVHPGVGFHPGGAMCTTEVVEVGDDAVTIRSEAEQGRWRCAWTFHPDRAEMLLDRADRPYWILYEGTPGGAYDEASAYCVDSAGRRRECNETWEERLPDPRWIYFAQPPNPYALFLIDRTRRNPTTVDSYWSMANAMTVFGFGRTLEDGDRWRHLTEHPCRLTVALRKMAGAEEVAAGLNRLSKMA